MATIHLHQTTKATPEQFLAGLTDFGHTYTLTPRPGGTTDVDVVVVREGKNLKGKLFALALPAVGQLVLGKALATTVKAIEAQNYPMPAEA